MLEYTDANNDITLQDIIDKLEMSHIMSRQNGKACMMILPGLMISASKLKKRSMENYIIIRWLNDDFELAELKLLVDWVAWLSLLQKKNQMSLLRK